MNTIIWHSQKRKISELNPSEYIPQIKVKNPFGINARNWQGGNVKLFCKICNKDFFVCKSLKNIRKFCSRQCYWKYLTTLKRPHSENTKIKIGNANSRKITIGCDFCGQNISVSPSRLKNHKRIFCSKICYGKFISAYLIREKSASWQGGRNSLHEEIRKSEEAISWKKSVIQRDKYVCQNCGQKGGDLEVHHIKSFSILLKEFLSEYNQFSPIEDMETLIRLSVSYKPFWDITNGRTLCKECHNKTKIYWKKLQCLQKI